MGGPERGGENARVRRARRSGGVLSGVVGSRAVVAERPMWARRGRRSGAARRSGRSHGARRGEGGKAGLGRDGSLRRGGEQLASGSSGLAGRPVDRAKTEYEVSPVRSCHAT